MTEQAERPENLGGISATGSANATQERAGIENLADAQTYFWRRVYDANRVWFERAQSEASMAADFAARLSSARSFGETVSLFRNWTAKRVEMAADDAKRALTDTQEIFIAGAQFWTLFGKGGENGGRQMT